MDKLSSLNIDHFYYNISLPHSAADGYNSTQATYSVETVQAVLDKPKDWYVSVVRFSIPGQSIPMTIFPTGDPSVRLKFSFTNKVSDTIHTELVQYIPNSDLNDPTNPRYYWIYNYENLIGMFNNTLQTLTNDVNGGAPGTIPWSPFFRYDPVSQLISLYYPTQFVWTGEDPSFADIIIGCNIPVYTQYCVGFSIYQHNRDQTAGDNIYFITRQGPSDINSVTLPNGDEGYIQTQSFVSMQYWNILKSVVFGTSSMPVMYEQIPSQTSQETGSQTGSISLFPAITDFEPSLQAAGDSRSQLQYYPQGPYRLVDLISDTPLRRINVSIYWSDKTDILYPLGISYGQVVTVKLMFLRKSSIKQSSEGSLTYGGMKFITH